mmetsp:Transcript_37723/g.92714  ORF Transcript_37723/g.92714 Transcript_37723/m.92714 type:complete len:215 (-) Transcript_37723:201-845(-)
MSKIDHFHIDFSLLIPFLLPRCILLVCELFIVRLVVSLIDKEDRTCVESIHILPSHHVSNRLQALEKPEGKCAPHPRAVIKELHDRSHKLPNLERVPPVLVEHHKLLLINLVHPQPTYPSPHTPRGSHFVFLLAPRLLCCSPVRRSRAHTHLHVKHTRVAVPCCQVLQEHRGYSLVTPAYSMEAWRELFELRATPVEPRLTLATRLGDQCTRTL